MSEIPKAVRDAVLGTYAAWLPFMAATQPDPEPQVPESAESTFDGILERIDAIEARIEYFRANPVFGDPEGV